MLKVRTGKGPGQEGGAGDLNLLHCLFVVVVINCDLVDLRDMGEVGTRRCLGSATGLQQPLALLEDAA